MKLALAFLLLVLLAVALSSPPSLAGPRSKREAVRARSTLGNGFGSQRLRRVYQNEPRPTQPPRYPTFIQIPKTRKRHTKRQIKEKERYPSLINIPKTRRRHTKTQIKERERQTGSIYLPTPAPGPAEREIRNYRSSAAQVPNNRNRRPYETKFPGNIPKVPRKVITSLPPIPEEPETQDAQLPLEKERYPSFINWDIPIQEGHQPKKGKTRSFSDNPSFFPMRNYRRQG